MTTQVLKFIQVKECLDGFVFWRSVPNDLIEIKFIPGLKRFIPKQILDSLK